MATTRAPQTTPSRRVAPRSGEPVVDDLARHDIAGVFIAVVAAGLAVALMTDSDALVAKVTADWLRLAFGAGAILVPVSLALFAGTFFAPTDRPISARLAVGLLLIVIAILAILSITAPGVDLFPEKALESEAAVAHGGYVGASIAWALLTLFGRVIGLILLGGVIVAGIIVCGFSISDLVSRITHKANNVREHAAERRQARMERRVAEREYDELADARATARRPRKERVAEASYLGERQTSVLRRSDEPQPQREARGLFGIGRRRQGASQASADDYGDVFGDQDGGADDEPRDAAPQGRAQDKPPEEAQPEPAPATHQLKRPAPPTRKLDGAERARQAQAAEQAVEEAQARKAQPEAKPHGKPDAASEEPKASVPDFLLRSQAAKGTPDEPAGEGDEGVDLPWDAPTTSKRQAKPQAKAREKEAEAPQAPAPPSGVNRPAAAEDDYVFPPIGMIEVSDSSLVSPVEEIGEVAQRLQATLEEFGLSSRVVDYVYGPNVTTFKIEMGEGERVNKITNLEDDIALSLAAPSVRIFAPIPGTSLVGIEIPNRTTQSVRLGDVLPYVQGGPLDCAFGRDAEGEPVVVDLAGLPHLLVAGTTGSGKSVFLNGLVMTMLMRATPEELRLIMVDPKRVEFTYYAGLPHLYVPVVTEPRQATSALQWGVSEMERRLKVFEHYRVRDIKSFNKQITDGKLALMDNPPEKMPYFVIVIDELSDLMMVAGKDVEASIVRIAQLGRAAGIHLIVATQRPSADVVTGLIKANIDNRVALSVDNGMNSRIIIDQTGAERLLGHGDMLYKLRGARPKRAQGCYTSEEEVEQVVNFIKEHRQADYHSDILSAVAPAAGAGSGASGPGDADEDDPLVWEAAQIVVESHLGSTSGLQRRLKVGYARAGRIMDLLEQKGVVGPPDGSKPREVLLDLDGLAELREAEAAYREV